MAAYLAVDEDGEENIFEGKPSRATACWGFNGRFLDYITLPKGTIKKLIGRELDWESDPVELTEELMQEEAK